MRLLCTYLILLVQGISDLRVGHGWLVLPVQHQRCQVGQDQLGVEEMHCEHCTGWVWMFTTLFLMLAVQGRSHIIIRSTSTQYEGM